MGANFEILSLRGQPVLPFHPEISDGVPSGIRTRVAAVRGRRPGPLDEGDEVWKIRRLVNKIKPQCRQISLQSLIFF